MGNVCPKCFADGLTVAYEAYARRDETVRPPVAVETKEVLRNLASKARGYAKGFERHRDVEGNDVRAEVWHSAAVLIAEAVKP